MSPRPNSKLGILFSLSLTGFLAVLATSCISRSVPIPQTPTSLPTSVFEKPPIQATLTVSPQSDFLACCASARDCNASRCCSAQKPGLPFGDSLKNTHILYQAYNQELTPRPGVIFDKEQIWVISVEDGSQRLVLNGGSSLGIAFLRDGYHFVLVAVDSQVLVSDLSGDIPNSLTSTSPYLNDFLPYTPIWSLLADRNQYPQKDDPGLGRVHSPDDKHIAIFRIGDPSLVILDRADNSTTEVIKTGEHDSIGGNWSPDGKAYSFSVFRDIQDYYSEVYVVSSDGTDLRRLTEPMEKVHAFAPKWSPDGKKVAFQAFLDYEKSKWPHEAFGIIDMDSGQVRMFSTGLSTQSSLMREGDFIWSPDSEWIAYLTSWGQVDILALNAESGEIYCVTNDKLVEQIIDWK